MIIFLYGADSYRSKQKLNEIIEQYKKIRKSGLNLLRVDAAQTDFMEFFGHFRAVGMFAEKKLVVLENLFSAKQFQEDFLQELKTLQEMQDIILVHEDGEPDARLKLFKALLKTCKCQEFKLLDAKNLKLWAQQELQILNAKINMDALDLLVSYTGPDCWRLHQEIKKLADYKQSAAIKKEDVELMVRQSITLDIFKTIDALAAKNKKQALLLLRKHLDEGENVLYLMSMIAFQFKNLLIVKELAEKGMMYATIVKKSGLHPFVVKKTYYACSQFSFNDLKRIYRSIFQTDLDIKTGKVEPETALDLLVAGI